ncbi:MAG: Uma2 family endonuclease [Pyrinomonadaceae bacterium]|nr:Uma2 family endonuclease [Pyrinomonadaceae bacterium]
MNTQTTDIQITKTSTIYPESIAEQEVYYPAEPEKEMGETAFHYKLIFLLYGFLEAYFSTRNNIVVAANMMVYYDEGNAKKWLAPDIFVCFGVENHLRRTFKTWEEGVFPQIVFEIASDSTFENDLGGKRLDYARLGVEEYYLFDPEREYLPSPLMSFHRKNGRLLSVNIENNRAFSPLLNLEIVDTGKSFRLFDPNEQKFLQAVLTGEE